MRNVNDDTNWNTFHKRKPEFLVSCENVGMIKPALQNKD